MLANKHMSRVHHDIKKECEQLAELCVRGFSHVLVTRIHLGSTGQSEAMGKFNHAKVSPPLIFHCNILTSPRLESKSESLTISHPFIAELFGR